MRTGLSPKHINRIVNGHVPISADVAISLEMALGVSAGFWLARDSRYQEFNARKRNEAELHKHVEWASQFPLKKMVQWFYLPTYSSPLEATQSLLRFFGVTTPAEYEHWWNQVQPSFRISSKKEIDSYSLAAWMRRGELQASLQPSKNYNAGYFQTSLADIRRLTLEPVEKLRAELQGICAECGVTVQLVPELPNSYVSGMTRWLGDRPLIQLSLRYKTDDMLWFAFFHEACHVLRHPRKATYIQDGTLLEDKLELEANRFAADMLIPPHAYSKFARPRLSQDEVLAFAASIQIAPGIVVGRLQHDEYLPRTRLNKLKVQLEWGSPIVGT